jgi:rhodanese-related sulfurtransferase
MLKLALGYSLSSFFFGLFGVDWEAVEDKIEKQYPAVSSISTDELAQKIQSASRPIVIDVREPAEFAVSHLSAAENLETGVDIAARFPDKQAPIVVYCSVGYRSAAVAAELELMGYSNVRNLHRSIFEWAEKGYQLRNANGVTAKIHPYNRAWGALVSEDLHAYSPE